MKILHVIYDDVENPWVGGGGALRAREINKLLSQNHSITTLTGNFPRARTGRMSGVEYIRLGYGKSYILSRITFSLLAPLHLLRCHCDIVVNEFSVFSPVFCQWFTKKPVVNTFYHRIGRQVFKKNILFGACAYLFEVLFLATAQNIITISPSVTREIKKNGGSCRIECIYTGVDPALFSVKPEKGDYIAFLGRLDIYMKGLDVLLAAFQKLPDTSVSLKIAGSAPEKNIEKITSLVKEYRLEERVHLLGRITDEEKKTFLKKSFFLVMPSRYEGWGIAAVEAAACGKAVIGSAIPGLQDAIRDGETGILVEPDNPDALCEAMMRLLENPALCREYGANGKVWSLNFRWEAITEKQEAFYNKILAEGPLRR